MPYYVSTSLGFITNTNYRTDNPKACCGRERAGDVRYAHPFSTYAEADRFAKLLTENTFWPRYHKYYSIMEPASSELPAFTRHHQESLSNKPTIELEVESPSKNAITRLGRAMINALS